MIMMFPVLQALKAYDPTIKILVVCSDINLRVAGQYDFIDETLLINQPTDAQSLKKGAEQLQAFDIEYAFNCAPGLSNKRLLAKSGAKHKASMIYHSRYKKAHCFSKMAERLLCWMSDIETHEVDRVTSFTKGENIHQTTVAHQLIKKHIPIGPFARVNGPKQPLVIPDITERVHIHGSGRWIKAPYTEETFINLVESVKALYGKVVVTTDLTSKGRFERLFSQYPVVNNDNIHDQSWCKEPVLVTDHLSFDNWQALASSVRKNVTIEYGGIHLTALHNRETIVVYHTDNCPELMSAEYYPWTDYFTPIICPRLEINDRVMQELKKTVALN
jgi:ADP-heptose:LPS heptosyltransferase